MKIKAKMVSLSIAAVLTIAFTGQCLAAAIPFTDLTDVGAKGAILALQEKGYVKGVGNNLFAPHDIVTSAEGVQLIVNAFNLNLDHVRFIKEPKATDYFTKANNDAWYANAFIVASINGLELPADLDPNQEWTREEFTYRLIHAMEVHGQLPMIKLNPVTIADQDQMTAEYDGAIQRALVYGVVKLDSKGKFNPKGKITRAEAAEQTYNALKYLEAHPAPKIEKTPTTEAK